MLDSILGALLPVAVTLALGMLAGWHGDEDARAAKSLNRMVLLYALPLALFTGTVTISREELLADWRLMLILSCGTLIPYLLAYLAARYGFKRGAQAAALQALAFGFPAIPFIGLPILRPIIQDKATLVVDFAGLSVNLLVVPLTLILLSYAQAAQSAEGQETGKPSVFKTILAAAREAITQPVVLAPLGAIACVLLGFHLPKLLTGSMKLLGSTVGGIALFSSGIILQSERPGFSMPAAITSAGRLIVIPGCTYLILKLTKVDHALIQQTTLGLGIAAAPLIVILATRYDTGQKENAAVLLYTNVFAFLTLGFFIWLTK